MEQEIKTPSSRAELATGHTTKTIELSDRFFQLIFSIVIIVAVFLLGQMMYQFRSLPQNAPQQISVSGEGRAFVKPDIAKVTFGMSTQGLQSQEVVDKNNQVINAVIKSLKDLGIEDKDIQTASYNLSPVYDYTERGRVFKGYSLDQRITLKIRNFDKISGTLDKITSLGANTVSDLQFTVDDPVKAQAEARAKAIGQAKEKAMSLASQSGLRIGKLVNVQEGYSLYPQPMYARSEVMTKDSASIAPEIQAGQMEVNSTVMLTYQLK